MPTLDPSTTVPTTSSSGSQWIIWHAALKERYGKATANTLFLEAWAKRKSNPANTTELRSYLEENGISIDTGMFGYAADFFDQATGYISMGGSAAMYAGIGLLALVVIPIFILLVNLARKPESIGSIAAQLKGLI